MKAKILVYALLALILATIHLALAQQPGKIFRIGFLDPSNASGIAPLVEAFRQELNKLGWIEGKNFTIEYRFAEGKTSRLPELAADLVHLKVDIIVVTSTAPALAAQSTTTTNPVVMVHVGDPVGSGLVASLARPGGNVTGLSNFTPQLAGKRLEILKDAVPRLTRVGILRLSGTEANVGAINQLKELSAAAPMLKIRLEEIETQLDPKRLENAFQTAKQKQG